MVPSFGRPGRSRKETCLGNAAARKPAPEMHQEQKKSSECVLVNFFILSKMLIMQKKCNMHHGAQLRSAGP